MRRLFTLEEATALLPRLRDEIAAMRAASAELEERRARLAEMGQLARHNGHSAEAAALEARIASLLRDLGARLDALLAEGIEVKDIDQGLLDFPAERDGVVVYLCWRVDEPAIAFWHPLDTGFQGRQAL